MSKRIWLGLVPLLLALASPAFAGAPETAAGDAAAEKEPTPASGTPAEPKPTGETTKEQQPEKEPGVEDRSGLAIGGQIDSSNTGLSVRYAIGHFHLQLILGADIDLPDVGADTILFDASIRLFYDIVRTGDTSIHAGVGATLGFGRKDPVVATTIDVFFGIEHSFSRYFAVVGLVMLPININREVKAEDGHGGVTIAFEGIGWGGGFHFFF